VNFWGVGGEEVGDSVHEGRFWAGYEEVEIVGFGVLD
jgi:hypothetical protein